MFGKFLDVQDRSIPHVEHVLKPFLYFWPKLLAE